MHIIPNHRGRSLCQGRDLAGPVLRDAVRLRAVHARRARQAAARASSTQGAHGLFDVVGIIMKVAPIGAFGAMAFTIGKYGVGTLLSLGKLMAAFYATCLIFIFVVLGGIARLTGFSIWKFIKYIKEELLIVLGTSSSESVLPRMIAKMENLGMQGVGRRPGHPHGLFVQPRRHLHLSDDGGDFPRAGNQHRSYTAATARHHRRTAANLKGSGRGHRQRVHRSGGDACLGRSRSRSRALRSSSVSTASCRRRAPSPI